MTRTHHKSRQILPTRVSSCRFWLVPEDSADPPRERGDEAADWGNSPLCVWPHLPERRPLQVVTCTRLRHGPEVGEDPAQRPSLSPRLAFVGLTSCPVTWDGAKPRQAQQSQVRTLCVLLFVLRVGHLGCPRCQASRCPPLVSVQRLLRNR